MTLTASGRADRWRASKLCKVRAQTTVVSPNRFCKSPFDSDPDLTGFSRKCMALAKRPMLGPSPSTFPTSCFLCTRIFDTIKSRALLENTNNIRILSLVDFLDPLIKS